MCNWKMSVSAFIFLILTVVKLIFPDQTAEFRKQTVAIIDMDMDYREAVKTVGSLLTDDAVQATVSFFQGISEEPIEIGNDFQSVIKVHMLNKRDEELDNEISSEVLGKVEEYFSAQEAYAEYDTPSNVCYTNLVLPFPYVSPVDGVCSSGFGYRVHPIHDEVLFHYGTDYDVEEGTVIGAFADGTVITVAEEAGYGKYVCLDHGNGWESLYAHCSSITVTVGQSVSMGDNLAVSGDTGRVTGPHLHFELMHEGMYTNPEFFLP